MAGSSLPACPVGRRQACLSRRTQTGLPVPKDADRFDIPRCSSRVLPSFLGKYAQINICQENVSVMLSYWIALRSFLIALKPWINRAHASYEAYRVEQWNTNGIIEKIGEY